MVGGARAAGWASPLTPLAAALSSQECREFVNSGRCSRGDSCRFVHGDPPPKRKDGAADDAGSDSDPDRDHRGRSRYDDEDEEVRGSAEALSARPPCARRPRRIYIYIHINLDTWRLAARPPCTRRPRRIYTCM